MSIRFVFVVQLSCPLVGRKVLFIVAVIREKSEGMSSSAEDGQPAHVCAISDEFSKVSGLERCSLVA